MLCACSGEQFKFDEMPQSPESLATRDFSVSGLSSIAGDCESRFAESQVDEVESTLKEALSLNYEEARALLGRLEYQRGNYDAALQVFQGINIRSIIPRMSQAIIRGKRQRRGRSKNEHAQMGVMSMHSVSLLLEAILLKAKSLEALGYITDAAKECRIVLEIVESAFPNGMPHGVAEYCRLQEVFHRALDLLPMLWNQAGFLYEAILSYRRALTKPWNLDPQKLAGFQKELAVILLHGGVETSLPPQLKVWGQTTPKNNMEEALLLLFILMRKVEYQEIVWDPEIMDHLTFALSISGEFEFLAAHIEQALPGIYNRAERWYFLALCYSAACQEEVALNLLEKISGPSESKHEPHLPSLLLGAKLCSQNPKHVSLGLKFAKGAVCLTTNKRHEHFKGKAHHLLGSCYGNAARVSLSDSPRKSLQIDSLQFLENASMTETEEPELTFSIALENAVQGNLNTALEKARIYTEMIGGSSVQGWKLLALVVSAEQRFNDAETIVDVALDECGRHDDDELELLRLKAVLQIAQEQPKPAIETYRSLLTLIHAQKGLHANNFDSEVVANVDIELEAWTDLASIYSKLGSLPNAEICVDKSKLVGFYSPKSWHASGMLFEAKSLYKEALVAFSISLTIEPDYVPSMVSTASVLRRLSKKSLPFARSLLMNALQLEPTNHEAWLNLGFVSKMEGSLNQAADFFQAAYQLKESAPVQKFV